MIRATVTGPLRVDIENPYVATFTVDVQGDSVVAALLSSQRVHADKITCGIDIWGVGTMVSGTHLGYNKILTFDHIQLFDPFPAPDTHFRWEKLQ